MALLDLIDRKEKLFTTDLNINNDELLKRVSSSRFLV